MAKEKEKDDDEKGKEPELVIVTDDERNLEVAPTGPETDHDDLPRPKVKEKPKEEDDPDEEDEEESRLGASEEMEREADEKDKQKSAHKSRRQRQKEAERRLRTERDFLEKRNETLEKEVIGLKRRMDSNDKSTLEGRITYTKAQIAKAEKIAADAGTAGKGDEQIEALKIRDNLRDSLRGMEERAVALEKEEKEEKETPAQPRPEVVKNLRTWMGKTKWFDPQLRDRDSRIVRALDVEVDEAGFDPGSPEYFEELDRRIAEVLPHRAGKKKAKRTDDEDIDEDEDEDEEETPRRKSAKSNGRKPAGGPRFRTGGPGRELKNNEVYLSPARIAAMKEAGAWEDPQLRQKYMKKYQEWDREHAHELDH